jgi:glutamate carboxypeptidase
VSFVPLWFKIIRKPSLPVNDKENNMNKASSYTRAIQSFLEANEKSMFKCLEELVLIQSGSHNKKGVDTALQNIQRTFEGMDVSTEVVEQPQLGNHLVVRSACPPGSSGQILIVGHTDTVFPVDTDFNWYKADDTKCYGPGVVDMKGGLVVGIFALKALQEIDLLQEVPLAFIFNSDEEIGSRSSLDVIQHEANQSAFAFVLECGGLNGEVVTGRKGNLMVELHVEGKAGHAAFADQSKSSAILEMAHKIIQFESLNDFKRGLTVNVGKVEGGIGPNTISEFCTAQIDFRYVAPEDFQYIESRIIEFTNTTIVKGTHSSVDFVSGRPPMQQKSKNRQLYTIAEKMAGPLGIPIKEQFRFGGSDANFIADLGIPVLDGLGPIGGRDHSDEEYMVKESLLQRTILFAGTLLASWEDHVSRR